MTEAVWSDDSGDPLLTCGRLKARLTAGPEQGMAVGWDGEPALPQLFAASPPKGSMPPATERYLRGADCFSVYPATKAFPFATQFGWSAASCGDGGARVTLTVSLQTDLLDTRPGLSLTTGGIAEPIQGMGAWRLETPADATVVIAPHPSDAAETEADVRGDGLRLTLSPPFLEKGVIRRCRLAAIWLPGQASPEAIAEALAEFAGAPLPLTA